MCSNSDFGPSGRKHRSLTSNYFRKLQTQVRTVHLYKMLSMPNTKPGHFANASSFTWRIALNFPIEAWALASSHRILNRDMQGLHRTTMVFPRQLSYTLSAGPFHNKSAIPIVAAPVRGKANQVCSSSSVQQPAPVKLSNLPHRNHHINHIISTRATSTRVSLT
jgi:hypothetical protein